MATFTHSYAQLARAQKTSVGVSYYSRWINRPWGRVLASAAHQARLTPNAVTGLSALSTVGGLAVLVFVPSAWWVGALVGFFLMLGFALDSADGQLARLRGGGSPLGEWLDHLVDAGKQVLVHVAVLAAAWRFWEVPAPWLLVPLGYLFVSVVLFCGILLTQFLTPASPANGPARQPSPLRSVVLLPADYGILCLAFLASGVPALFCPLYSALGVLTALITAGLIASWSSRLRRAAA